MNSHPWATVHSCNMHHICTVSSGSQKLDSAKMSYPISLFLTNKIALITLLAYGGVINIDYLMVGLRYGFYPRVTDVISRTSEVRASE